MRPNPKLDADFYRKVNQQLHTKDKMIRSLQQRLEELQARIGSRAIDPNGHELELELADIEQQILEHTDSEEVPAPHASPGNPGRSHPEHDSALSMALEPPASAETPAPHVPSPLATSEPAFHDVTPMPRRKKRDHHHAPGHHCEQCCTDHTHDHSSEAAAPHATVHAPAPGRAPAPVHASTPAQGGPAEHASATEHVTAPAQVTAPMHVALRAVGPGSVPSPAPAHHAPHAQGAAPAVAQAVASAPAVHPVAPGAVELASLPERIQKRITALRPHLTDPTLDDSEVLSTALRLYDWFLRRHAQGFRVQLVNDEDTTTEVDLVL